MRARYMAGVAPASFAHLMGAPAGRARAEGDDPKDRDKEMRARKARRAAEDKKRVEEDDRRKKEDAKRAEEDGADMDDDPDDRGETEDDEIPDPINTDDIVDERERKKDDDDHDPDEVTDDLGDETEDDEDARKARRAGKKAERARWTKVLGHKEAAGRVGAACSMLANGDMNAGAIVATLKTLPAQAAAPRPGLRERMSAERPRNPGPNTQGNGQPTFAESVIAAGKKARGEK